MGKIRERAKLLASVSMFFGISFENETERFEDMMIQLYHLRQGHISEKDFENEMEKLFRK